MLFKKISLLLFIICISTVGSAQKYLSKEVAETSEKWNDNTFISTKSFADNILEAPEFSILSKSFKDNSLSKIIEKNEMVTIFALTDAAFSKLDKKEREALLGNKKRMTSIIKFLIIPGRIDKHGLEAEAKNHGGKFYLTTLNGQELGLMQDGGALYLFDNQGHKAAITETDFLHKNGFFHIVDGLVFPDSKE